MNHEEILKHLIMNSQKNIVNASKLKDEIPLQYQGALYKNGLPLHELKILQTLKNVQSNMDTADYQTNALKEVILFIEKDGYDVSDFSIMYNFDEEEGLFIFISADMKKSFAILYKGKGDVSLFYVDENYEISSCKNIEDAIQKDQNRKITVC